MQALSKLAILFVVAANLAGLHGANGIAAGLVAAALIALAAMHGFDIHPPWARRAHWLSLMRRHRDALTKRYRQVVRMNAYGYEDHDKWLEELDRFRRSVRLPLDVRRRLAFERLATRTVRAWSEADAEGPAPENVNELTPEDYEHLCADLLRRAGWDAEVTGMSGDQGVDVVAEADGVRVAVQCKLHFANPVGNKAVQEAHAASGFIDADRAVVVSNGDYTRAAEELAHKLGVLLLHHSQLPDLHRLVGTKARPRRAPAERRDPTLVLDERALRAT